MLRICGQCGTGNRVPMKHLADRGKCGACRGPLPAHHSPVAVSELFELDHLLSQVQVPVLVELPPRAGRLALAAAKLAGRAVAVRVPWSVGMALASRYRLDPQPRYLVFRRGRLMQRHGDHTDPAALDSLSVERA
jgi:thioredoxin 2